MHAISTILFLIILSVCDGKPSKNKECVKDNIEFKTKVDNSSVVVYGSGTGDVRKLNASTYRVEFDVTCVLKGSATPKHIYILTSDREDGRRRCQGFQRDEVVIAFIEQQSSNDSTTFVSLDFDLVVDNDSTTELLANTCGLRQQMPLDSSASVGDVCPVVSTDPQCTPTTTKPNLAFNKNGAGLSSVVMPSGSENDLDRIRTKSGSIQVDVDTRRDGANSINTNILLLLSFILLIRWN